jgi:hypothetical protein
MDSFIIESNKPQPVEEVAHEAVEVEAVTPEPSSEEPSVEVNEAPQSQSKSRAQKRIESLIQEKHDLARKVQELEAKQTSPKSKELEPDDFEDYDDYLSAVADENPKSETKKESAKDDSDLVIEQITEKFEDARDKYTDFNEKVSNTSLALTIDLLRVINESDDAGEVAYYLANNPKETKRIAELSPAKMAIEIGKIESKLSQPQIEAKLPTKKATQAQDPISPVGGSNSIPKTIYQADSQAEFEAMRKQSTSRNNGFV